AFSISEGAEKHQYQIALLACCQGNFVLLSKNYAGNPSLSANRGILHKKLSGFTQEIDDFAAEQLRWNKKSVILKKEEGNFCPPRKNSEGPFDKT
ncbi:MAG: hypothetical protein RRY21_05305, partial [Oscillospiraceae bacterium]